MDLRKRLQRKITIKVYERQCMIILTMLTTLLLIKIWSRFRSDAMSVGWKGYILLIVIFIIPFFNRLKNRKTDGAEKSQEI